MSKDNQQIKYRTATTGLNNVTYREPVREIGLFGLQKTRWEAGRNRNLFQSYIKAAEKKGIFSKFRADWTRNNKLNTRVNQVM